jgi:glycosyltransferase involved in cell wall biosynthesis
MISVVCPFFNEEAIIEASVRLMLLNLAKLTDEWELIIVDDGSRDRSLALALELEAESPRLRVLSYGINRGRGYAIRIGAEQARGDVLITTEIDSSWGDDIVSRIAAALRERPDADVVIASPHMADGGYRNVPLWRVLLSNAGNYIIRSGLSYSVTMNTGMTRGYRRKKFLALPLDEDGKEMHIEIVSKAIALGYRICEIPAVLEWKADKLAGSPAQKRKSSSVSSRLIRTHLLFSLMAAPFRYLYVVAALLASVAAVFFTWSVINILTHQVAAYLFLSSLTTGVLAFLIFGIGVLAQQGHALQRDLWKLRSELRAHDIARANRAAAPPHTDVPAE